jgi:hypothetical protein
MVIHRVPGGSARRRVGTSGRTGIISDRLARRARYIPAAGLDHCHGDATVIIDVDLQDPPEVIPQLVAQWQAGYDDVYAQRLEREGESWLKRATSYEFHRVVKRMGRVEIPEATGDFRLLSRRAVTSLLELREQPRFMKGLYLWVGYPSAAVPYQRRRGGRHDQVELLEALEHRAGRYHAVFHRAAESGDVPGIRDHAPVLRPRDRDHFQGAGLRRSGARLSVADGRRAVSRWRATRGARHHAGRSGLRRRRSASHAQPMYPDSP